MTELIVTPTSQEPSISMMSDALADDPRVVFAYLYGSFLEGSTFRDIDIAVYAEDKENPYAVSADLKLSLRKRSGQPPDFFDIRIINGLVERGDLFALLYLKRVFEEGKLLLDRDYELRTDLLERYGTKYRECEGLFDEVLL
jgi:predicted nucleotidyltransferase